MENLGISNDDSFDYFTEYRIQPIQIQPMLVRQKKSIRLVA